MSINLLVCITKSILGEICNENEEIMTLHEGQVLKVAVAVKPVYSTHFMPVSDALV
jgi:hypothetical protein